MLVPSITTTAGWLEYSCCAFGALLLVWRILRKRWTNFSRKSGNSQVRSDFTRGVARPLTSLALLAVAFPSATMGYVAGYYSRDAKLAKLESGKAIAKVNNTETYTWFKVIAVYDHWGFKVQFLSGGEPFDMRFLHDGSDLKLGWDPGMIVESCTFEKTFDGLTVADDRLGMTVWRYPNSPKFVDYREVNYRDLLASNKRSR